jgi:hypothetical protein
MDGGAQRAGVKVYIRMAGFALLAGLVVWAVPPTIDSYQKDHLRAESTGSPAVIIATWALTALLIGGCIAGALLTYRDATRRDPTSLVFPGLPISYVGEVVLAGAGAALTFVLAYMIVSVPMMLDPAPYGPKDSVAGNLALGVFMALPGLALLFLRPAYRINPGTRSLVRHPIAAWIPWKKKLPYQFTVADMEWTVLRGAGQSAVGVAWAIYASLPEDKQFVIELLSLNTPREEIARRRAEWQARLLGA